MTSTKLKLSPLELNHYQCDIWWHKISECWNTCCLFQYYCQGWSTYCFASADNWSYLNGYSEWPGFPSNCLLALVAAGRSFHLVSYWADYIQCCCLIQLPKCSQCWFAPALSSQAVGTHVTTIILCSYLCPPFFAHCPPQSIRNTSSHVKQADFLS